MNPYYPTLFSPCKIGNVVIKNRICKAPQTTGLSHMDGTVSSRLVRCYEDLARGEVGMIIVEYAYVDRKCSKSAKNADRNIRKVIDISCSRIDKR